MLTNTAQPATDLARLTKRHGRILLQLATGGYYGARRPETGRYEAMYEAGLTDRAYSFSEDHLTELGRTVLTQALRDRRMVEV